MAEKTAAQRTSEAQAVHGAARIRGIGGRLIMKLPAEASLKLPSRGQVAVDAVVNGHAFAAVLEPDGMKGHWLSIDDDLQRALGVDAGAAVTFVLQPAEAWPEPDLPLDFQNALAGAPETAELWKDITAMARWEWVRWINATKNPKTRQRRIETALSKLVSGKRRPCCFDLSSCTDPELAKNGKLAEAE